MIYVAEAQAFEAVFESGQTGLVGTVEAAIVDNDGNTVLGPTTTNITENSVGGTPTGTYTWNVPAAPATAGQYTILWSEDGSFDPHTVASEDLVVIVSGSGSLPPIPPPEDGGASSGPCTAWVTSDDALLCCSGSDIGTDSSVLDEYVGAASEVLFSLSGRIFSGLCEQTARPCRTGECGCGIQILSRGYVVTPWEWMGCTWGCNGNPCGCEPLSRVLLSGYPVREIIEVKIDGDIVDPDTYRLDSKRWLVRIRDPAEPSVPLMWPSCQALDLPDTEDGTFSVTYTSGQNPPLMGQLAAGELACEIFKSCNNSADCNLPSGTTRVIRQGVVVERLAFAAWGLQNGIWRTGLSRVDAFLNAYNPLGETRRPRTWSPDGERYARVVG